jgi:hypothetical protein
LESGAAKSRTHEPILTADFPLFVAAWRMPDVDEEMHPSSREAAALWTLPVEPAMGSCSRTRD